MHFLWATGLSVLFSAKAHAYLDPSSGGMLLQLLLGGVAGILTVVKIYFANIKAFLGRWVNFKNTKDS
jgi:type IV secretory pathway VirB2 component (pilin)